MKTKAFVVNDLFVVAVAIDADDVAILRASRAIECKIKGDSVLRLWAMTRPIYELPDKAILGQGDSQTNYHCVLIPLPQLKNIAENPRFWQFQAFPSQKSPVFLIFSELRTTLEAVMSVYESIVSW